MPYSRGSVERAARIGPKDSTKPPSLRAMVKHGCSCCRGGRPGGDRCRSSGVVRPLRSRRKRMSMGRSRPPRLRAPARPCITRSVANFGSTTARPLGLCHVASRTLQGHPSQARPIGHARRSDQCIGHSWRHALGDIVVLRALAPLLRAPDPEVCPSGRATNGRFPCGGTARAALSRGLSPDSDR